MFGGDDSPTSPPDDVKTLCPGSPKTVVPSPQFDDFEEIKVDEDPKEEDNNAVKVPPTQKPRTKTTWTPTKVKIENDKDQEKNHYKHLRTTGPNNPSSSSTGHSGVGHETADQNIPQWVLDWLAKQSPDNVYLEKKVEDGENKTEIHEDKKKEIHENKKTGIHEDKKTGWNASSQKSVRTGWLNKAAALIQCYQDGEWDRCNQLVDRSLGMNLS